MSDGGGRGVSAVRSIARTAVDGSIAARAERDRRGYPAFGADGLEIRAGRAAGSLVLARYAAIAAALRFVLKTFFCIELLIANGEYKRLAAVLTDDAFVFQGVASRK